MVFLSHVEVAITSTLSLDHTQREFTCSIIRVEVVMAKQIFSITRRHDPRTRLKLILMPGRSPTRMSKL
jgi:hypothetical protein